MRRYKTLREVLAVIYNIISIEGEISEYELIKKLEIKGISDWTFAKRKKYLMLEYPDIKKNKSDVYYIGRIESSLSTLSPPEKETGK